MNILPIRDKNNKLGTIYYGIVKDIEDPLKQGRIKVELPEIYGKADTKNLPWIYPIGYNCGLRLFHVPDLETEVGIIFIGDFYTGFYGIGKYPKGQEKLFDKDYPYVYGFEDAAGNYLTINKKTGEIKFHHKSGTEFIIDNDGNTKAIIKKNFEGEIEGDSKLKVKGNSECEIEGNLNAKVKKDFKLEVEGSANIIAKDLTVKTSGDVNFKSPKVNLGEGGKQIARIGDKVSVDGKSHVGTITGGGTNTSI